jgi:hypothetical protein
MLLDNMLSDNYYYPKSIYYIEGNPNVVVVGTCITFKISSGNSVCGPPPLPSTTLSASIFFLGVGIRVQ